MRLIDLGLKLRACGIRNVDVANDLGISEKAVSEWVNGKKFPNDRGMNYLLGKLESLKAETNEGATVSLTSNSLNPPRPSPQRKRTAKGAGAKELA